MKRCKNKQTARGGGGLGAAGIDGSIIWCYMHMRPCVQLIFGKYIFFIS